MSSANSKNPQGKKATASKGMFVPFDSITNPYNFEGHSCRHTTQEKSLKKGIEEIVCACIQTTTNTNHQRLYHTDPCQNPEKPQPRRLSIFRISAVYPSTRCLLKHV